MEWELRLSINEDCSFILINRRIYNSPDWGVGSTSIIMSSILSELETRAQYLNVYRVCGTYTIINGLDTTKSSSPVLSRFVYPGVIIVHQCDYRNIM